MTTEDPERFMRAMPCLETLATKLEEVGFTAEEIVEAMVAVATTIGIGILGRDRTVTGLRICADRIEADCGEIHRKERQSMQVH